MKTWIATLVGVGLVLQSGCRKNENRDGKSDASDLLVRCHFVGSGQLAGDTNAAKLKEIWNLPETRRLAGRTLGKLSHAPKTLFAEAVDAAQDERGAALLRPLLDDVLRQESFIQVRGATDRPTEWTLLVRHPGDRSGGWRTAIGELLQVWKLGNAVTNTVGGMSCLEVKRSGTPGLIRWAESGDWFALGIGQEAVPTFDEALRRIKSGGRPIAAASGYWLEAELNLPRLARWVGFSPSFKWPVAQLSVIGHGENLRSTGRMTFADAATGPLNPWQIPTNLIHDPLISFTAARGIEPLFRSGELFNELGVEPVPNELFVWAQSQVVFQTFWAWPDSSATNNLQRIAERAPSLLGTNWQQKGLAQIGWIQTNQMVFWKALPIVTPYLRARPDGGRDYVVGGLFAAMPGTNPPPDELLSQVTSRTNMVYYDWEITQGRLRQWHVMAQTLAVIRGTPQFATNSAGLAWMMSVAPHLGNSITEIVADTPARWSLTRKSHAGLTGFEIVALTRWLESTNFPKLSFDLPATMPAFSPRASARPQPK